MSNNTKTRSIDTRYRAEAISLVHKCGVRADLKGSESLVDAILLYSSETCTGFCDIYRTIAERRGLKPKSILREINYALTVTENVYVKLSELTGLSFVNTDMHASLVIAYLARMIEVPKLILK